MAIRLFTLRLGADGGDRYAIVKTGWGHVGLVCRGSAVRRLVLPTADSGGIVGAIEGEFGSAQRDDEVLPGLQRALVDYFDGKVSQFDCRVDVSWAGDFARAVLRACCRVRRGRTVSYGELARQASRPGAARAVGAVMASNRIPLLIPCHRVVCADGSLGGYSGPGGSAMKKRLLEHEGAANAKYGKNKCPA